LTENIEGVQAQTLLVAIFVEVFRQVEQCFFILPFGKVCFGRLSEKQI